MPARTVAIRDVVRFNWPALQPPHLDGLQGYAEATIQKRRRRLLLGGKQLTLEASSARSGGNQQLLTHAAAAGTDDINATAPPNPTASPATIRIEIAINLPKLFILPHSPQNTHQNIKFFPYNN